MSKFKFSRGEYDPPDKHSRKIGKPIPAVCRCRELKDCLAEAVKWYEANLKWSTRGLGWFERAKELSANAEGKE